MPTYAYKCKGCNHEFERFQSITAKPIRKCPSCGKTAVKRLIGTGAGIIFRGSGFYQTDYRSDTYKKAADGDKGGADKKDTTKKDASKTTSPAGETGGKPLKKSA